MYACSSRNLRNIARVSLWNIILYLFSSFGEQEHTTSWNCKIKRRTYIIATTRETEVTLHSDSGIVCINWSECFTPSPMLSEELSGYNEVIAKINRSIDAPISKLHETVLDMNSGRSLDGESDVESDV
ncbi:hypothetical protein Peur_033479 [Populus x canadensis]